MKLRRLINSLINFCINLFMPLFYVAFLLGAGTGCAVVSALIEYDVVMGLFPKSYFIIPLLLVAAFEVGKVFLIFQSKQYDSGNYGKGEKAGFLFLRSLLILFSFVATLFFSFYNLDNPEYEKQLAQRTQIIEQTHKDNLEELKERYQNLMKESDGRCERERERISRQYQPEIDKWYGRMREEEKIRDSRGNFNGSRYKTFKQNYNDAKQQRDNATSKVVCDTDKLTQQQKEEVTALQKDRDQLIATARDTLHGSMASGNKFVTAALSVVYNVRSEKDYPHNSYITVILLLSILISFCMEATIWAAFTVLSVNHGQSLTSGFKNLGLEEELKQAQDTINRVDKMKMDANKERIVNERKMMEDTLNEFNKIHKNGAKAMNDAE